MSNCWLVKTEPGSYAFADLAQDRETVWDGVSNALALKHIRAMKRGDEVLVYHSGKERAIVGDAKVSKGPHPDPEQDDERLAVVRLRAGGAWKRPVPLSEVKADPRFAEWELVRVPRLSVMPVPAALARRLRKLGSRSAP